MSKIRNIEVEFKYDEPNMYFATQRFSDWYDFADWLKQANEMGKIILIRNWRYEDKRI